MFSVKLVYVRVPQRSYSLHAEVFIFFSGQLFSMRQVTISIQGRVWLAQGGYSSQKGGTNIVGIRSSCVSSVRDTRGADVSWVIWRLSVQLRIFYLLSSLRYLIFSSLILSVTLLSLPLRGYYSDAWQDGTNGEKEEICLFLCNVYVQYIDARWGVHKG